MLLSPLTTEIALSCCQPAQLAMLDLDLWRRVFSISRLAGAQGSLSLIRTWLFQAPHTHIRTKFLLPWRVHRLEKVIFSSASQWWLVQTPHQRQVHISQQGHTAFGSPRGCVLNCCPQISLVFSIFTMSSSVAVSPWFVFFFFSLIPFQTQSLCPHRTHLSHRGFKFSSGRSQRVDSMPSSGDVRLTSGSALPAEPSARCSAGADAQLKESSACRFSHTIRFCLPSCLQSLSGLPGGKHCSKQKANPAWSVLVWSLCIRSPGSSWWKPGQPSPSKQGYARLCHLRTWHLVSGASLEVHQEIFSQKSSHSLSNNGCFFHCWEQSSHKTCALIIMGQ